MAQLRAVTEAASASTGAEVPTPAPALQGRWPHTLSQEPLLRVSDVLALVQPEFPTLTTSKLRFLDTQGLVSPYRTAAGYRQYSPADVERLRFVLRQQRDHYRPLTVIAEHLDALDRGRMQEPIEPYLVDDDDSAYLSTAEIAQRAGVDDDVVLALDEAGLVEQAVPGGYARAALAMVVAAGGYLRAGGDIRSMRTLRNAASREVDHATAVGAPARARGDQGEADACAQERGEAAIALFGAMVRRQLEP